MKKNLVFDLDGTLFDTLDDIIISVKKTFENLKLDIPSNNNIKNSIGWGSRQLFLSLLSNNETLADKALLEFSKIYIKNIANETRPYPGVIEVISQLKKDFSIHIMTNKPRKFALPLIDHFKLKELFDSIITPDDTSHIKKPDDRLCSLDMLKNALYFIGDSEVDLEMAYKCNIPSVFVTYGYGSIDSIEPDHIINNFHELLNIIKSKD